MATPRLMSLFGCGGSFGDAMIIRPMMRCLACSRWWSGEPVNGHAQHCPCGGELAVVDMVAHLASLPTKVDTPAEVEELRLQKERAAAAKALAEAEKAK